MSLSQVRDGCGQAQPCASTVQAAEGAVIACLPWPCHALKIAFQVFSLSSASYVCFLLFNILGSLEWGYMNVLLRDEHKAFIYLSMGHGREKLL